MADLAERFDFFLPRVVERHQTVKKERAVVAPNNRHHALQWIERDGKHTRHAPQIFFEPLEITVRENAPFHRAKIRYDLRMRWVALGLLFSVVVASCGGRIAGDDITTTDAGQDATLVSCTTSVDCPNGTQCLFSPNVGCSSPGTCLPPPIDQGQCKGAAACACDGATVTVCGGESPTPIRNLGPCGIPTPTQCTLACEDCDTSNLTIDTMSRPTSFTGACSASDISGFVAACVATTATQATCEAWQTASLDAGACASCILTLATSASWGPFVCDAESCVLDTGGCIDLELGEVADETSSGGGGSCGDLYNASDACVDYVCNACAPPDDATCMNEAQSSVCAKYEAAITSSSACASDAGSSCFPNSDADDAAFINLFCGTSP
jgi:hypothetical protein